MEGKKGSPCWRGCDFSSTDGREICWSDLNQRWSMFVRPGRVVKELQVSSKRQAPPRTHPVVCLHGSLGVKLVGKPAGHGWICWPAAEKSSRGALNSGWVLAILAAYRHATELSIVKLAGVL
jgi:hypothetical protein